MALGSNNPFPSVLFDEGSAPTTPASGFQRLFIDTADGHLKRKNSAGTVKDLEPVGAVGSSTIVVKAANESITSSTALQNDDELLFAIGASQTWLVEFELAYNALITADISMAINVPSGATGRYQAAGLQFGAGSSIDSMALFSTTDLTDTGVGSWGGAGSGVDVTLSVKVIVINSTNAGNVQLRWCQRVSISTATIVRAGSYLRATRIA